MYEEEDEEVVRDALKHLNAEQQEWRLELAAPEVRRRGRPCEGLTQEETECLVRCEAGDGMGQGFFVCVFRREEREVMGEEERKAKERAFEEEMRVAKEEKVRVKDVKVKVRVKEVKEKVKVKDVKEKVRVKEVKEKVKVKDVKEKVRVKEVKEKVRVKEVKEKDVKEKKEMKETKAKKEKTKAKDKEKNTKTIDYVAKIKHKHGKHIPLGTSCSLLCSIKQEMSSTIAAPSPESSTNQKDKSTPRGEEGSPLSSGALRERSGSRSRSYPTRHTSSALRLQ